MTRLNWRQDIPGEWHVFIPPKMAVITVWVRCPWLFPEPPKEGQCCVPKGKWEVVLEMCYWSRDKGRYFDGAEEAKEAAEKLLGKVGTWLREELGAG